MIRSRGSIVSKTGSFKWTTTREADGVITENLTINSSGTFGRTEVISYDDTLRKGPIKTTRFCHHVVREECDKVIDAEGYFSGTLHFRHPGYVGFPTFSEPVIPDLTNFHAEAMNFFKAGCTDTEVPLLASLAEIGELKNLGPQLLTAFRQLAKRSVDYTWRSLKKDLKAGADVHLSYSFGIKPILSDIKGVYSSLSSLEQRIRYLKENSGKPQRVQFTRVLPNTDSRAVVTNDTYYQVVNEFTQSGNYVAYATVTYDVSKLSDWELRLRILKKQLGLTDLLSTAWELIPFSFLIDWIVNIGDVISQIPDVITIPMKIGDCGWYVKMEHGSRTTFIAKKPFGNPVFNGNWRKVRLFHREPGIPRTFASLVADGDLSLQQLGLGISLSLQKWR